MAAWRGSLGLAWPSGSLDAWLFAQPFEPCPFNSQGSSGGPWLGSASEELVYLITGCRQASDPLPSDLCFL